MEGEAKPTKEQKEELAKLKKAYDDANKVITHMNSEIEANTNNIRSNTTALAENADKIDAKKNSTIEATAEESRSSEAFYSKAKAQMQEDLQTSQMTNAQKAFLLCTALDSTKRPC